MSAHRFSPSAANYRHSRKDLLSPRVFFLIHTHTDIYVLSYSIYIPVHAFTHTSMHTCLHTPVNVFLSPGLFPLISLSECQCLIMKMSIKSISGVMSAIIFPQKDFYPPAFFLLHVVPLRLSLCAISSRYCNHQTILWI